MTAAPEFHRPQRIDMIGAGGHEVEITATPDECAALAVRFGLIGIDRLEARFTVRREADGIVARGRVTAAVRQPCIATGDPVPASIDEQVALRFVPEDQLPGADEVELDADDCDTIAYAGGAVDLGEAAAETMALALDPYPRSLGADAALRAAGVKSEEEAGPFGALAGLRDKLAR